MSRLDRVKNVDNSEELRLTDVHYVHPYTLCVLECVTVYRLCECTTRQWMLQVLSSLSVTSSLKSSILPVKAFMLSSSNSMDSPVVHYVCAGHCGGIAPVFLAVRLSPTSVHR